MNKQIALVPLLYDEFNYGGVLQFYALQEAVRKLGYTPEILYIDDNEKVVNRFKSEPILKCILRFLLRPYLNARYKIRAGRIVKTISKRIDKIIRFKENNYSGTKIFDLDNISEYKAVICGSDQIWNPKWARRRCFLEFVPEHVNKIIYAASLGVEEMSNAEKDAFKPRISRLDHVSVREYSAKEILDGFTERDDIVVVADPTLLLTPDEWRSVAHNGTVPKEKYVFTYFLGDYSKIKGYVSDFATNKGLKIVNIPFASGERIDNENFGDIKIIDASPEDFLALIENAEYVFTDSFHACVFSTLFQKEFYVFERDGSKQMSGRIQTLLKNFDLPDRFIPIGPIPDLPQLDFSKNGVQQEKIRQFSISFLKASITNGQ